MSFKTELLFAKIVDSSERRLSWKMEVKNLTTEKPRSEMGTD